MSDTVENVQQDEGKPIGQHLKQASLMSLFPTPLIVGEVEDDSLCQDLQEQILKLRDNKEGYFEAGNFVTDDQLHVPGRGFEVFSELVLNETKNFLDFLKVKRDNHYISGMWANVTNPNHRHPVHIHPNSLVSGILYIKTPENCGKTAFTDPRPAARVLEPSYEEMFEFNSGLMRYPPKRGTMLMWPSWLTHGVDRGFCVDENDERITIAFNVMMLGKIDTMTGKLELN
jgi:uncharacterized protein (TIGR02466 family)